MYPAVKRYGIAAEACKGDIALYLAQHHGNLPRQALRIMQGLLSRIDLNS